MAEARSLWFLSPGRPKVLKEALPSLKRGWCEVKTLFSAVSPGTEKLVFAGKVPSSLWEEMRCPYMAGTFAFPVKYGYSIIGSVEKGPRSRLGEMVHVMHPHQDRCRVRTQDAFSVPANVPARRATLMSNLETAVNAVWDSKIRLGERALVVGFGIIGSLTARLVSLGSGTSVVVTDISSTKLGLARNMGFQTVHPDEIGHSFDLAFHASGTSKGLQTAIDSVSFEGRIIETSWYGTDTVHLSLGEGFHSRRKKIISSQVSRIPAELQPRWDLKRRKKLVVELLENPLFDSHLTHNVPFQDLPKVFRNLKNSPFESLGYLVEYG